MMEFSDNQPIYKQIVNYAFNCIIDGTWTPGARIPSVRELAAGLGVNTRTVLKSLEDLQALDLIEPKRGMGFTLAADAVKIVGDARRREFFEATVPALRDEMNRLGITVEALNEALKTKC